MDITLKIYSTTKFSEYVKDFNSRKKIFFISFKTELPQVREIREKSGKIKLVESVENVREFHENYKYWILLQFFFTLKTYES